MIVLILWSLVNVDPPAAADRGHSFSRAGLTCTEIVDPASVPLTGEVRLTLSVEGEKPLEIEPVSFPDPSGWRIRAAAPSITSDRPGGRQRWQVSYRAAPDKPGEIPLPPPILRARVGGRDTPIEINWPPLTVRVTTTLPRVDLDEARGITGPEPSPPASPLFWRDERVWAAAIVLIVISIVIFVGRGLRPAPPATPTLEEWAMSGLNRIATLDPANPASADELANLLRQFLASRFHLAALGKTTGEVLTSLRTTAANDSSKDLGALSVTAWQALLERCDLARFASAGFTQTAWVDAVGKARQLIVESLPIDEARAFAANGPHGKNA